MATGLNAERNGNLLFITGEAIRSAFHWREEGNSLLKHELSDHFRYFAESLNVLYDQSISCTFANSRAV